MQPIPSPIASIPAPGRSSVVVLSCALLWAGLLAAQSPQPAPAKTDDEIFVLSPFIVQVDRDVGFVAATSLSGGRLGGELRDTPVAYSVLTRDFIDALGLTDLADMAQWTPNSSEPLNMGNLEWSNNDFYLSSRGVTANRPQRDFFPYGFNFDSYNIERLDLGRGPNSILFGNSGYGSTANSVSKRALTGKAFSDLRVSYGSWARYRATFDHNQPLNDKLALRANFLYLDSEGWQDRDYEKKLSGTIAGTWRPFRQTEIRFEAERGTKEKAARAANFDDFLSAWGGATYDARLTSAQAAAAAMSAAGIARQASRTIVYTPSSGENVLMNYEGRARTEGGNLNANYPAGGQLVVGPSANIRNTPILNRINLPGTLFSFAEANSNFQVPSREFTTMPDATLYTEDYDNFTFAITQQVGSNFYAEAAFNYASLTRQGDISTSRGLTQVFIDINSTLPNGDPNPNFLEPYSEGRAYPHDRPSRAINGRLAMAYLLENTPVGSFRFNLLAGSSRTKDDQDTRIYVLKDNPDPREWPTFNQVRFRYYLNTDDARPYDLSDRTWTYINPVTNTTQEVAGGLVREFGSTTSNTRARTEYDYVQLAAEAKLFKQRLNLLAAVRHDSYLTLQRVGLSQRDYPVDWNGRDLILKPDAPADWADLTYRPILGSGGTLGQPLPADIRPRISGVPDARYADVRFQDDYNSPQVKGSINTFSLGSVYHLTPTVSLFANYAESFVPPLARYDITGRLIDARSAEGRDLGVRLTLLGGKLVANLIRYKGIDKNNIISGANFRRELASITQANPVDDPTPGGLNARNLPVPPNGVLDTIKSEVSGWEFEVTANLTQNWRLSLNGALAEGTQSGTFPKIQAYLATNDAVLRQIVQDAGGIFNGNVATYDTSISVARSPEGPGAVDAWNNIQNLLASITTDKQKLNRLTEATANLFTDYSFRSGRLKGWRVGVGANYRGRQTIGYRGADTIRDPANPARAIDDPSVGPLDVVYQPGYTTAMATITYTRRINQRLILSINLRVNNLFDYDKPIYISSLMRPMDGDLSNPARVATPVNYFWITPRNFNLTATLKF
jgi:outer membrane receptor protein involved in Fe transport